VPPKADHGNARERASERESAVQVCQSEKVMLVAKYKVGLAKNLVNFLFRDDDRTDRWKTRDRQATDRPHVVVSSFFSLLLLPLLFSCLFL
jgi:hypothetical protein